MRQVVIDTETTGLEAAEGHRIIEIAAVELDDRQLTGHDFHALIDPERGIDVEATKIHGITDSDLEGKPIFRQIAEEFLGFVAEAEVIMHNAPFDAAFIDRELDRAFKDSKRLGDTCASIIDTLELARRKFPGQQNSLDALCRRFGIDISQRELHNALLDAQLTARVYLQLTGGQSSLFEDDPFVTTSTLVDDESGHESIAQFVGKLQRTTPSASEIAEHQRYLNRMQEESDVVPLERRFDQATSHD